MLRKPQTNTRIVFADLGNVPTAQLVQQIADLCFGQAANDRYTNRASVGLLENSIPHRRQLGADEIIEAVACHEKFVLACFVRVEYKVGAILIRQRREIP